MANKRFNQQVAQPRMGKMGGGMMNKRSMMKDGSTPRKSIEKMLAEDELKKRKRRLGQTAAEILKKSSKTGKGGGADTGTIGEIKSRLSVAMDKLKKSGAMGKDAKSDLQKKRDKLKDLFDRQKNRKEKEMIPLKKGGRATLKKGSKFPDHSGDGKITQKDILMAKGVIPKKKNNKKVI